MFDAIKELRTAAATMLSEKFKDPFTSTLIGSWLVWNWELMLVLLFADDDIYSRIEFIKENYIDIHESNILGLFAGPLASAILLTVFYPFMSAGTYRLWLIAKKMIRDEKYKFEKGTRVTTEEMDAFNAKSLKITNSFTEQIDKRSEVEEQLQTKLSKAELALNTARTDSFDLEGRGSVMEEAIKSLRSENQKLKNATTGAIDESNKKGARMSLAVERTKILESDNASIKAKNTKLENDSVADAKKIEGAKETERQLRGELAKYKI